MNSFACPCGRKKEYNDCCALPHKKLPNAKTAEDLMRSRYSAFVLSDGDYLMKSHHKTNRPLSEKEAIVQWSKSVKWLRLEVLNSTKGTGSDTEGTVEFKAFYKSGLLTECIHENSKFIKENDSWFYLGIV